MGCEPDLLCGRPYDLPGCAESTNPSLSFCPPGPRAPLPYEPLLGSRRETVGRPCHCGGKALVDGRRDLDPAISALSGHAQGHDDLVARVGELLVFDLERLPG